MFSRPAPLTQLNEQLLAIWSVFDSDLVGKLQKLYINVGHTQNMPKFMQGGPEKAVMTCLRQGVGIFPLE